MRAGEGSEDEVAGVRLARRDVHARDALVHLDELRHVREVELRVDAECKHIHADRDDIDVARALAVAEQRALDAVRTGQDAHLRIGDAAAAVVVRMQREHDVVAVLEMLVHVSDLHRKDMRHAHLDRCRQVDDGLAVSRRLPDIEDSVADLERVLRLRARKGLRRILEAVVRTGFFRQLLQELGAVDGHLLDLFLVLAEDLLALCDRSRVVDVDDGVLDALQGIERLADDVLARLRQDLDRHIVRDQVFLDEAAQELVLRLRCSREADLDFLEADFEEHLVEFHFLIQAHRDDERLVAIAKVDAAPDWRMVWGIFLGPLQVNLRRHEITFAVLLIIHHLTKPPQIEKPFV